MEAGCLAWLTCSRILGIPWLSLAANIHLSIFFTGFEQWLDALPREAASASATRAQVGQCFTSRGAPACYSSAHTRISFQTSTVLIRTAKTRRMNIFLSGQGILCFIQLINHLHSLGVSGNMGSELRRDSIPLLTHSKHRETPLPTSWGEGCCSGVRTATNNSDCHSQL